MKLIVRDGTELNLVSFSNTEFTIHCDTQIEFLQCWSALNKANLLSVTITDDAGNIIQSMQNLESSGVQAVQNDDGSYTGHFFYFGATYKSADDDYIEAAKILLGEE